MYAHKKLGHAIYKIQAALPTSLPSAYSEISCFLHEIVEQRKSILIRIDKIFQIHIELRVVCTFSTSTRNMKYYYQKLESNFVDAMTIP